MKYALLIWLCYLFPALNATAQEPGNILAQPLKTEIRKAKIIEWFRLIENEGIVLSYNPAQINTDREVVLRRPVEKVEDLLQQLIDSKLMRMTLKGNKIIFSELPPRKTISGYIREKGSGETLIGAYIMVNNKFLGCTSNEYGFFCLSLPQGEYALTVRHLGYIQKEIAVNLADDQWVEVGLEPQAVRVGDVVVKADKTRGIKNLHSDIALSPDGYKPSFMGNDDIFSRMQFVPGVIGRESGASVLQVRGGNNDQNLILLDGIPVYNYSHFTDLLSIFNSDALKNVNLHKGLFPSKYEGRLASVVDIRMRDGDQQNFHASATVDLLTTSLLVEGPIKKDESSFLFSARRSWIDLLSRQTIIDDMINFSLYDINLKLNYKIGQNDHIYLSGYIGADTFRNSKQLDENESEFRWSNELVALRWNHLFSSRLFKNTALSYSRYRNAAKPEMIGFEPGADITSQISDLSLSTDLEYYTNDIYTLRFGAKTSLNNYTNTYLPPLFDKGRNSFFRNNSSVHLSAYFENNVKMSPSLEMQLGLHYLHYITEGQNYDSFQPRIVLSYKMDGRFNLFAGFSRMAQFYHQISFPKLTMPYEFRCPSSKDIKPGLSGIYELGCKHTFQEEKGSIALSLFHSERENILSYRPQQDILNQVIAPDWNDRVIAGTGRSQGVELSFLRKFKGGELQSAYTLSKSKERYAMVNQGLYANSDYDRPHVFKSSVSLQASHSSTVSLTLNLQSGMLVNYPVYAIPTPDQGLGNVRPDNPADYVAIAYNEYRLPFSYRMDLGYTYTRKSKKSGREGIFRCGLYNLVGKNSTVEYRIDTADSKVKIEAMSLRNFLPYLSFTYKM